MSEHLRIPQFEHNEPSLPNQPFFSWLKSHNILFIGQILAILAFIGSLAGSIYYILGIGKDQSWLTLKLIRLVIDFAHIFIISIFIGSLYSVLDKNDQGSYRISLVYERIFNKKLKASLLKKGKKLLKSFKVSFLLFWFAMLALYVSFTIHHGFQPETKRLDVQEIFPQIQNFKQLANDLKENEPITDNLKASFDTKIVETKTLLDKVPESTGLNEILDDIKNQGTKDDITNSINKFQNAVIDISKGKNKVANKPYEAFQILLFPFFTFALNNLSLMFVFWCFTILCFPSFDRKSIRKQTLFKNFSFLIVLLFTASFPLLIFLAKTSDGYTTIDLIAYNTAFNAISGALNAVVLALLIARLDSKLIGLHSFFISVLYVYAAVQPLFVAFEQPEKVFEVIMTFVLIFVFIFKIYFFYIIVYSLQTGRLLNYFLCFPTLAKRVDSIFANQFQIEILQVGQRFSFIITKKNIRTYVSDVYFKNRGECRKQIEEIREIMLNQKSYIIVYSVGNYWIEVFNNRGKKLCHSIDLKSMEDTKDLKFESIEKIPHCKVIFT